MVDLAVRAAHQLALLEQWRFAQEEYKTLALALSPDVTAGIHMYDTSTWNY